MIGGVRTKIKKICHGVTHERKVLSKIRGEQNIFYFGVPMHPNLGDLAQCMCIRDWLKTNYPNHNVIEIDSKVFMDPHFSLRKKLRNMIKKEDLIIFQSGYCTQDLGGVEDLMHQAVMEDYPDNRMVMMPQTVFFKTEERKKQCQRVYNAHRHLLFLARDKVSFEMAQELFPDVLVRLYPDIVTTLIGSIKTSRERSGILMCMRNDLEKYYTDEEVQRLRTKLESYDTVEVIDTTIQRRVNAESPGLNDLIMGFVDKLVSACLVVTDRYHGTILSVAANTPVIVVKTTDHKVVTGVDWFKGIYDDAVFFAETLEEVEKLALKILKENKTDTYNRPYFKEKYYDELRRLIEKELN